MAQQVLVQMVDDLDGTSSDDVSTISFGLDGVEYEIDLSDSNAESLRNVFEDYVAAGRRTGGRKRRGASPGSGPSNNGEAGRIREWALENGFGLAARGRIPSNVVEAYKEATSTETKTSTRKSSRKKK